MLEEKMKNLSSQLDNIKGRMNRFNNTSKEKIQQLTGDRPRATTGDVRHLETIQELHDEIGDGEPAQNRRADRRETISHISPIARSTFDLPTRSLNKEEFIRGSRVSEMSEFPIRLGSDTENILKRKISGNTIRIQSEFANDAMRDSGFQLSMFRDNLSHQSGLDGINEFRYSIGSNSPDYKTAFNNLQRKPVSDFDIPEMHPFRLVTDETQEDHTIIDLNRVPEPLARARRLRSFISAMTDPETVLSKFKLAQALYP